MNKKVLIIDDEVDVLFCLEGIFEELGFDVTTANLPDEGLSIIETDSFDLVVVDLEMPHIAGDEVLEKIKDKNLKKILIGDQIREDNPNADTTMPKSEIESLELILKKLELLHDN